jgi:hypothetical protein
VYGTWSGFETRVGLELVADLGAIVRIYMDTSFDSLRTRRVAHGCSQPPSLVTSPAGFCAVVYFSKKKKNTSPLQKNSPLFFVPDFISYLLDPAMKVHQKKLFGHQLGTNRYSRFLPKKWSFSPFLRFFQWKLELGRLGDLRLLQYSFLGVSDVIQRQNLTNSSPG